VPPRRRHRAASRVCSSARVGRDRRRASKNERCVQELAPSVSHVSVERLRLDPYRDDASALQRSWSVERRRRLMRSQGCQRRASVLLDGPALCFTLPPNLSGASSFVLPSICLHLGLMGWRPGVKTLVNLAPSSRRSPSGAASGHRSDSPSYPAEASGRSPSVQRHSEILGRSKRRGTV
jgi:hypothetical protein